MTTTVKLAGWTKLRLLAETAVALRHTLGTGSEQDNRALDQLEREVWLELAHACPDRREREHVIENAHAIVAPPGAPSCRHAARLVARAGGLLHHEAAGLPRKERERVQHCARHCVEGAVRLERIALETG